MALQEIPEHAGRVGYRVRYLDLDAEGAAVTAVLAAAQQGLEGAYIEALVEAGDEAQSLGPAERLTRAAERCQGVGLDYARWLEAATSEGMTEAAATEAYDAQVFGVRASPTWFVDGYRLRGLQSQAAIERVIAMSLLDGEAPHQEEP